MAQKFAQSLKLNRGYVPSQPVAGEANDTVYAGENVIFKGSPQNIHAEVFRGNQQVTSPGGASLGIPGALLHLANLLFTNGSDQFSRNMSIPAPGPGPLPQPGSTLLIDGKLYLVTQILNAVDAKLTPAFEGPTGGHQVFYVPTLCGMNDILGVCYGSGNAVSLPQGHVLLTGVQQKLVLIGSPAPTGRAQLLLNAALPSTVPSIIRQSGFVYQPVRSLGFAPPPPPVLAALASGTKNMPAGRYSIRLVRASLETAGYGNPSEATELTITAGQRIEVTFPIAITNQTSWRVFASLYSVAEGITGPWYEIDEVTEQQVAGATGRKQIYEWRDYEIAGSQLVTFDNNIPPAAGFIAVFGGSPVLISTQGRPEAGTPTAPGPSVQPGKAYNAEGYPPGASLAMGPVQDIVSFVEGEGRLYVATNSYVHILTLTGNPDQPLTVRPFVQTSIIRHNALIYVEGVLYGYSARGPVRVSGEGTGQEDRIFAAPVRATTEKWKAARVFVVYDPHNESILWVHSNDSRHPTTNTWRTMVLSYSLPLGIWSTPIWIDAGGALDTTVTGVATLSGRAFLITSDGILLMWDASGDTKQWFMSTPYMDQPSVPGAKKNIRHLTVTHRGNTTIAEIFGLVSGGAESTTSLSGPIALPAVVDSLTATAIRKINVRNLRLYCVRLSGINHLGDPLPDRVDEIIIDGNVHGPVT